ncbi:MAG: 50S ribosomal protein L9 [Planctomycetota bacterium]|nr:MAG: 50S ribosomal protein L9 [Planctomycetota bacterium]
MGKNVEVLLKEDVLKLGSMGDIVSVRPGYARNFLLPHGKAIPVGQAAKRQIELLREQALRRQAEMEGQALSQKKQIDGLSVQIAAKVSSGRTLFGSVGIREIVVALDKSGFTIDPKQVHLHESFKTLGTYPVIIRLFKGVDATIEVEVVDADPQGSTMEEVIASSAATQQAES